MPLEAADIAKINELMADALKNALKPEALAAAVAPVVKAHTEAAMKGVVTTEGLEKFGTDLAAKLKPAEPDPKAGDPANKSKGADDPTVQALTRKVAEMEAANKAALEQVAAEKAKARIDRLHVAARDALAKAGIPADRLPMALAYVKELGVLDYDGDQPGWKGKSSLGLDAVLPMDDAAAAWAKADGKVFLPPTGAGGTGDGNRGGSGGGNRNGTGLTMDSLTRSLSSAALGGAGR